MVRTIEHFILHERWEQNKKELMEILEIYSEKMKKILEKMIEFKIIKVSRKIANSKFYRLNKESNLIRPLRLLMRNFSIQNALSYSDKIEEEKGLKKEIKNNGG